MGGDERRCSIADQALERVAGHHDGLSYEPGEPLFAFVVEHQCVHHVLGDLVDTDEQTVFLAADEDRFAVDAQHPTPSGRTQFGGDIERCLGGGADLIDPAVDRIPRYRSPQPALQQRGQRPIRRQPLHVQADRLDHNVVGGASPPPSGPPFQSEARAAGRTQEALKRPERAAQTTRTRTRIRTVALGCQPPARRATHLPV